jgi:heat shock protein HslJ
MRRLSALMTAASLTMGASAAMAAAGQLDGTAWTLSELPGQPLLPDRPVTLRLADGRAHGTDGCNSYTTSYQADGETFQIGPSIAGTRIACPQPVMQQAQAFIDALTRARAARIDARRLTLVDAGGQPLAVLLAQSQALAGTAWQVTGYNNGKQAVVSTLSGSTLTLQFSADGKVTGSAGCNRYQAPYSAAGETITIGKIAATRKMCTHPERIMEQENTFLKALEASAAARIDGNRLELRDAKRALVVTAARPVTASSRE